MLEIGQELQQGRYRVRERLTQGGMGTVYLATDRNLGDRLVAVKENSDTSPRTQEQFQREAAMLARLTHPNLPRVTDYFIEPSGRQYLVMDYIPGEDLRQIVIRRGGQLPEEEVLAWLDGVLNALEYMHGWIDIDTGLPRPIIHRDIKPSNIKRTPNGRIVLVDFGLAKYHSGDETQIGARAVTPGYSPLEQYTGGTDVRSDIYALGATLYALLTGERPPDSPARASGAPLPLPRQRNPTVSRNTERVILRALQMQASERFQTVQEMRDALAGRSRFAWGSERLVPSAIGTAAGQNRRNKGARAGVWIGALSLLALLTFAVLVATMLPDLLRPNPVATMSTAAPDGSDSGNGAPPGSVDEAATDSAPLPVAALLIATTTLTHTPAPAAGQPEGAALAATAALTTGATAAVTQTLAGTPAEASATEPSPTLAIAEPANTQSATVFSAVAETLPSGAITVTAPSLQVETPAATPNPTVTETSTSLPTATPTLTPEPPATASDTPLPTDTPAPTATPTLTPEPPATASDTPLPTDTPAPTTTPTLTPEPTATASDTPLPTNTPAPTLTPEPTATASDTPPPTNTPAPTVAPTPTPEPTATASDTPLPTNTPAPTATPTPTPEPTATASDTPPPTNTPAPTATPTRTPAPTATASNTRPPTNTPAPTATPRPTATRRAPTATAVVGTPPPGATRISPIGDLTLVYIPAGQFTMGSTQVAEESPVRVVTLSAFWIMQTEVTNAQYERCVQAGACTPPNNTRWREASYRQHPVTNVEWGQANEFAVWAGGRLPTEAEWEKAARGVDGRLFPWGDEAGDDLLNFNNLYGDTLPVGQFPAGASVYGVLDMAGNVDEWVADWYAPDYYATAPSRDPGGPEDGILRVVRGGSFVSNLLGVRTTARGQALPGSDFPTVGFRIVIPE